MRAPLMTTSPARDGAPIRPAAPWLAALACAVLAGLLPAVAHAQSGGSVRPSPAQAAAGSSARRAATPLPRVDAAIVRALRGGGHLLACRHALTDASQQDRGQNFDDPSTQRRLSAAGEQQAERLGDALRALGIPIGEVLASPYDRTLKSAALAFGRVTREDALFGSGTPAKDAPRRALVTGAVAAGGNRVLMTHQGILYRTLPDVPGGSIGEGDCVVLRPAGARGYTLLAHASVEDWERLARR